MTLKGKNGLTKLLNAAKESEIIAHENRTGFKLAHAVWSIK